MIYWWRSIADTNVLQTDGRWSSIVTHSDISNSEEESVCCKYRHVDNLWTGFHGES